jgi:formamidopyrimidine-DNA glycosylase
MPELPEVETVRRGLERIFAVNNVIEKVELKRPDLREPIPTNLPALVAKQPILAVRRRAKYLLLDTPERTLISHLGMSGTWRVASVGEEELHDHVYLTLADGTRLAFNDPRRFGILDIATRADVFKNKWLKNLGLEPFDAEFTPVHMQKRARRRAVAVKNFIMDQKIVVGVGNIYASEALFMAGVKPARAARLVKTEEWTKIVKAVKKILQNAIDKGGTTLRDHRMVDGETGEFQTRLKVYDREGEPCTKCRTTVKMKVLGQRSTYWCPTCQK